MVCEKRETVAEATDEGARDCYAREKEATAKEADFMTWIVPTLFLAAALAGAWFWGKVSDPRKGGTVGCCHCGQCLTAGECVLRKSLQKKDQ